MHRNASPVHCCNHSNRSLSHAATEPREARSVWLASDGRIDHEQRTCLKVFHYCCVLEMQPIRYGTGLHIKYNTVRLDNCQLEWTFSRLKTIGILKPDITEGITQWISECQYYITSTSHAQRFHTVTRSDAYTVVRYRFRRIQRFCLLRVYAYWNFTSITDSGALALLRRY